MSWHHIREDSSLFGGLGDLLNDVYLMLQHIRALQIRWGIQLKRCGWVSGGVN